MSLINDMLRDLEGHRPPPRARAGEHWYAPRARLALLAGLGAFVLASAVLLWLFWPPAGPEIPAVEVATASSASPTAVVAPAETGAAARPASEPSVATAAPPQSESRPQAQTPPPDSGQPAAPPLPELLGETGAAGVTAPWLPDLARAEAALGDDRLTLPAHDSAYLYYQRVLAADPGNAEALAGIKRIAARYGELANAALAAGEPAQARRYWHLALRVEPGFAPATEALAALDKAPPTAAVPAARERHSEPLAAAATKPAAILEEDGAGDGTAVQLSLDSREQQQVQRAQQLAAEGDAQAARRLLQALVDETDPARSALPQARRTLLGLYLQAGDRAAAEALIVEPLSEEAQACLRARLLVDDNRQAEALALLEAARVARGEDEACRALLAGLYHHTGQYASAQHHYQRLMERFGERARYWLGLALALDARQSYSAASVAYQRVLQSRDLTPTLQTFARDRLAQLND